MIMHAHACPYIIYFIMFLKIKKRKKETLWSICLQHGPYFSRITDESNSSLNTDIVCTLAV